MQITHLKKNIELYINFFVSHNIDIMFIQEPGPFINRLDINQIGPDLFQPFLFKTQKINSFNFSIKGLIKIKNNSGDIGHPCFTPYIRIFYQFFCKL